MTATDDHALGRVAAVLALASAVTHLPLADASDLGAVAMVVMALACLPCAHHLWRRPTASVWVATAAIDAVMLVLHTSALAGDPVTTGHHAGHGHSSAPAAVMWVALALVAAQLLLGSAALIRHRRDRSQEVVRPRDTPLVHHYGR